MVRFVLGCALTGVNAVGSSASASGLTLEACLSGIGNLLQGSAVLSGILAESEVDVRRRFGTLSGSHELVLLVEQGSTVLVLALLRLRLDLLLELRDVSLVELLLLSNLVGLA